RGRGPKAPLVLTQQEASGPGRTPDRTELCRRLGAGDLEDLDAGQVEPGPPLVADEPELDAAATGAAGHDPGGVEVDVEDGEGGDAPATGAGGRGHGEVGDEDLTEEAA